MNEIIRKIIREMGYQPASIRFVYTDKNSNTSIAAGHIGILIQGYVNVKDDNSYIEADLYPTIGYTPPMRNTFIVNSNEVVYFPFTSMETFLAVAFYADVTVR